MPFMQEINNNDVQGLPRYVTPGLDQRPALKAKGL